MLSTKRFASAFLGLVLLLGSAAGQDLECKSLNYTLGIFEDAEKVFGACSSHGTCISGVCVCEDFWTGRSDIINTEGIDCQINTITVKVLWAINLVYLLICQKIGVPYIKLRWDSYKAKKAQLQAQGGHFPLSKQRVLLACFVHEFICVPSVVILALLRISSNEERVGLTFASTFFFATGKIGFYLAVYFFQPALFATTLQGLKKRDKVQQLIRLSDNFGLFLMIVSILLGFMPFIVYANGEQLDDVARLTWIVYIAGMGVSVLVLGAQAFYLKVRIVKVLTASYSITKDEKIEEIKKRISEVQMEAAKQGFVQSLLYFSFLLIPHLWNKHDYFLPISWLAFILLGKKMAMATVKDGGSKSSKEGGSKEGGSSLAITKQGSQYMLKTDQKQFSYSQVQDSKGESDADFV